MNRILTLLISLFSYKVLAIEKIMLDSIGFGSEIRIVGNIELPNGQKLNQKAPSKIAVYEQLGTNWVLTEDVDLNDFFSLTELINFQKPIQLRSEGSKIKIFFILNQC